MDATPIYLVGTEFVAEPVPRWSGERNLPPGANPRVSLGWQSATVVICRTSLDRRAESVPLLVPRWRTTARRRAAEENATLLALGPTWIDGPDPADPLQQTRGSLLPQCLMVCECELCMLESRREMIWSGLRPQET